MTILISQNESLAASLMAEILRHAKARGWSQNTLAQRASVPDSAVGLRLTLLPDNDYTEKVNRGELF
jgi:ribosome-binding protein aMBF1 (putative translation factor)